MIVDFAAHLHPERVFPAPMDSLKKVERVGSKLRDPEELATFYRESRYDRAVLSQPFYMGSGDPEAVAHANDALLDVMDEYEEFYGLAAIPASVNGSVAAEEFERCLETGYHGGGILTRSDEIEVLSEELTPVFDVAEKYDAPLMVHPKLDDSLGEGVFEDDGQYFMNAIFGREVALCQSICGAIHGGLFDRHPDLKLAYHHLGGNIASMLGRVQLHQVPEWWGHQDALKPTDEFRSALERNIYLDTSGYLGAAPPLRNALEEFPTSQILLGTDCPFEARTVEDMQRFPELIDDLSSDTDARQILGENALRILANTE